MTTPVEHPAAMSPSRTPADAGGLLAAVGLIALHWRCIVLASLIGLVLGGLASVVPARRYTASMTFIPQSSAEASASGSLALAASQLGLRMPTAGGAWGPAVYTEVIISREILGPLARDSVQVAEQGGQWIPIADLLRVRGTDVAVRTQRTVKELRKIIAASEMKRLGAVKVTVTTRWPSVSFALTRRLLDDLNQFNLSTRQSQAKAERQFAETQSERARRELQAAEMRLERFLTENRTTGSPSLQNERERIQRDVTLKQQALIALLQGLEEARLREVRDTPVLSLIEAPEVPYLADARGIAQRSLLGGFAALGLAILVMLVRAPNTPSARLMQRILEVVRRPG